MALGRPVRMWILAGWALVLLVGCDALSGEGPDPTLTSEGPLSAGFSDAFPELPLAEGGRVEVPLGIAVTFPDDWTVRWEPSEFRNEPDSGMQSNVMLAEPLPRTGEGCGVTVSRSSAGSLDRYVDGLVLGKTERGLDAPVGGPTEVLLPVGDSIFLDGAEQSEDGRLVAVRAYYLRRGDTYFMLSCFGPVPPDDRWFSIAETFEFLPVEEGQDP